MTSESTQLAAALPVRRRGTLEIFDTALKLYRRYFWVLIGWSALSSVFTTVLSCLGFLVMPVLFGAVSCCVAAAVRGQKVTFSQCWQFTKPRYGAMLGGLLLSGLVFMAVLFVLYLVSIFVGLAGFWILSSAPGPVQVVVGVIGGIVLMTVYSVIAVLFYVWMGMVPLVACLEDDKRGSAALGRSFELMNGNWRRIFGMSLILGLAMLVVFIIVGTVFGLLNATRFSELTSPGVADSDVWGPLMAFSTFFGFFYLVWNPAQFLITAILYLDLRVRREALDLEWAAYATAPPAPSGGVTGVPIAVAPLEAQTFGMNPSVPDLTPASFAAGGLASDGLVSDGLASDDLAASGPAFRDNEGGGPVELTAPVPTEPTFADLTFDESSVEDPALTAPVTAEQNVRNPVIINGIGETTVADEQAVLPIAVPVPSVSAAAPVTAPETAQPIFEDEHVEPFEIKPFEEEFKTPGQDNA